MIGLWKKNKKKPSRTTKNITIPPRGHHQRRHGCPPWRPRKLLIITLAILVGFWMAFCSTSPILLLRTSSTSQKTILINNHGPLLLLPNQQQPGTTHSRDNSMHRQKNVLRKPFQWYRDHWYTNNTNTNNPLLSSHDNHQRQPVWQNTQLPSWMKDYFEWHHHQQQQQPEPTSYDHPTTTNNNNNQNQTPRYLILQCLEQDRHCGGLADRLLVLPFLVLVAAQSQRQLKIVWTVPCPLEEFLLPHNDKVVGVDWMLPAATDLGNSVVSQDAFLSAPSVVDKTVFVRVTSLLEVVHQTDRPVVRARIQDYATAWDYYDQYHVQHYNLDSQGTSFAQQHYRELFFVLFQPSPPLAQAMQEKHVIPSSSWTGQGTTKEQTGLPPEYAVAHYRSLYGSQTAPSREYLTAATRNAVNCASQLLRGGPVVFLSDSAESVQTLMGTTTHGNDRVFLRTPTNHTSRTHHRALPHPLHLDKATRQERSLQSSSSASTMSSTEYEPYDFYDTFLDLFLMARARCVSFGQGGFGKMGSLLSGNRTCTNRHFEHGKMVPCAGKG